MIIYSNRWLTQRSQNACLFCGCLLKMSNHGVRQSSKSTASIGLSVLHEMMKTRRLLTRIWSCKSTLQCVLLFHRTTICRQQAYIPQYMLLNSYHERWALGCCCCDNGHAPLHWSRCNCQVVDRCRSSVRAHACECAADCQGWTDARYRHAFKSL